MKILAPSEIATPMVVRVSLKTRIRDTATGSVSIARAMRILPMMERKPIFCDLLCHSLSSLVASRFLGVSLSYNPLDMVDNGFQSGAGTIISSNP
jgi:hypothetical protein